MTIRAANGTKFQLTGLHPDAVESLRVAIEDLPVTVDEADFLFDLAEQTVLEGEMAGVNMDHWTRQRQRLESIRIKLAGLIRG